MEMADQGPTAPMMTNRSPRCVAVIGGGIAGLTAAWRLLEQGASVAVYESDAALGGLASSFSVGDGRIDRYYHFICLGDHEYRGALGQLGLLDRLRWRRTKMGQFHDGRLYSFGDPWDPLFFRPMRWSDKVRFALGLMSVKHQPPDAWCTIDDRRANEWLTQRFGRRTYELIYKPLIERKFGHHSADLSAAWMWARIHRLGKSRTRVLMLERLGYLDGGTTPFVEGLSERIRSIGGTIHAGKRVETIELDSETVRSVGGAGWKMECDAVLSTVPIPILRRIVRGPGRERLACLDGLQSIGVTCAVLRLSKSLTRFFWLNISDPRLSFAGIIEYTNLNPGACANGDHIVYIPQYTPPDSVHFGLSDAAILDSYIENLKLIVPEFSRSWVRDAWVFRDSHAQPICPVGFSRQVARIASPVEGLYLTDSHQLYPDDRTISNSIALGTEAAELIGRSREAPAAGR